MSLEERIEVSRRIEAPAAKIFALISDPHGQVQIDGSGMLIAAPDAQPLTGVGDTFVMNMDREPLGDIPMGKYTVLNTVTAFVPDAQLEWNVAGGGRNPIGHVYGYLLEPDGEQATLVISYYDWSGISDRWRARGIFPVVPADALTQSLAKLDRLVSRGNAHFSTL
jgi:hypothetical protein